MGATVWGRVRPAPPALRPSLHSQRLGVPRRELPPHHIPAIRPWHLLLLGERPGLRLLSPGWQLGRQELGAGSGGPVPPLSGGTPAPSPALTVRWKEGEGSETPVAQGALPSPAEPVPVQQASVPSPGESAQTPRAVCPPGAHHLSWAQSLSLLPGALGLAQHNTGAPAVAPGQPPGHLAGR